MGHCLIEKEIGRPHKFLKRVGDKCPEKSRCLNNLAHLTLKFIAKRISLYQNIRNITKIYTR